MNNRMKETERYTEIVDLSTIHPQIFIIDMVNGFCKEGALADQEILKIVDPIKELLEQTDSSKQIFIADTHLTTDIEFEAFPPHCVKGTNEAEIIDELMPYVKTKIIEKNTTNAFHELIKDENRHLLEELDTDSCILVGCCTDICVMQFALSLRTWMNAVGMKRRILIPRNCIETFNSPSHDAFEKNEAACDLMSEAGIEIVQTVERRTL